MGTQHKHQALETFNLLSIQADLRREWVLGTLSKAGFPQNDATLKMIDQLLPLGNELAEPKGIAHIHEISALDAGQRSTLPEPIQQAQYLFFAVGTAGTPIDEEASRLRKQGDLIESMVVDAIALTALYQATAQLTTAAHDWARDRQLGSSRAFSPGSGRNQWTLPHQALLFEFVPAEQIGVQLMPSFLMLPTKSVSFVLGMGKDIAHVEDPFSCAGCPRVDCAYRHEDADEMVTVT